uniref:GDNF family receptor alpha-4a isoform X3 n=1 Tax=Doryrhamphus excisus TaxID=161450 RepID=UPI0025AE29E3|nr:GDNF family receptor alpha-4a isoform X3 [Doryrhamphus excisus]
MPHSVMDFLGLYFLQIALLGLPRVALSDGSWDCLRAGDACSGDDTCSPRLRTLRQCVAGDGSVKLGPGARNQCENAMTALLSTPLHGCQCKRGMKKEKNCLSIYWSLQQSVLHGLHLVEDFPYEPEERGSDYVRLASIAAESEVTTVNRCLDAAKACNIDETCQKLRTEYVSSCIQPSARSGPCNRPNVCRAPPPDHRADVLVRGQGQAQLSRPAEGLQGRLRVQVSLGPVPIRLPSLGAEPQRLQAGEPWSVSAGLHRPHRKHHHPQLPGQFHLQRGTLVLLQRQRSPAGAVWRLPGVLPRQRLPEERHLGLWQWLGCEKRWRSARNSQPGRALSLGHQRRPGRFHGNRAEHPESTDTHPSQ